MPATHSVHSTPSVAPVLYVAFELSSGQWKPASCSARGQRARIVSVPARDTGVVLREPARAKARFGLPENAEVFSCYEAGRDDFWLHRFLHHRGISKCYRRLAEHRGEPSPSTGQGGQLGCHWPGRIAHSLLRRRDM